MEKLQDELDQVVHLWSPQGKVPMWEIYYWWGDLDTIFPI